MLVKNAVQAIVIGGSSGGVNAWFRIVSGLKNDFQIPLVVVLHQSRKSKSSMIELSQHRTKLKVKEPLDKEKLMSKTIYIAPPDYHLMLEKDLSFSYSFTEAVNYSRPSIDVLFETAADAFQKNIVAVLLTGANADGAKGLKRIKETGGFTIVQNPADAESPVMQQAAIDLFTPDFIGNLDEIITLLNQLKYGG